MLLCWVCGDYQPHYFQGFNPARATCQKCETHTYNVYGSGETARVLRADNGQVHL